jgi:hypothetical protein
MWGSCNIPESQKMLTEEGCWKFFELVSDFIEASSNFIHNFLDKTLAKYFENHQRFYKSTDLIFRTIKDIFSIFS